MKDIKKVEKEIKEELKQTSRKSRKDMDALRQQVRSKAREFKKAAGDVLDTYDVEREIRHERIRAEAAHLAVQHQLKNDVEAEAKEYKKLISRDGGSANGVAYQHPNSNRLYGRASD